MKNQMTIDEKLITEALKATGLTTQKEVIELALQTLIRLKKQEEIRKFKGNLKWEGNLEEMRQD